MLDKNTVIGVAGAGAMGAGIAQVAAQAGHNVIVLDQKEEMLARGRASVEKGAAALLKRGKISETEATAIAARVQWTLNVADLAKTGLIIEAIVENAGIKQTLFKQLEETTGDETVIATNTSSLSVTGLAGPLARPKQFLGLHFFNPAPIMKLVEVVSGVATDSGIAEQALHLMENWGKVAVKARDVPGFIVNRVARPYYSEGWRALEEGAADATTLDFLYRDLAGFRMGPFELGDLIGHDINYEAARSVFDSYFGRVRFIPSLAQGQLVAAGHLGRKSGRGVFGYGEGAEKPAPKFAAKTDFAPGEITVCDDEEAQIRRYLEAFGIEARVDEDVPTPFASMGNVLIEVTAGQPARLTAWQEEAPVVVLDWMRDPKAASAIAFAASDNEARHVALSLAGLAGKSAVELSDRAGLVVFRTLAQLANCAADAVRDRVADADSIDRAMINGVNYPFGPMAWARELGPARLVDALHSIAFATGDNMYHAGEVLLGLDWSEQ